ncbi:MAG: carboxypeptidase regulatory-like domain-containing protein, partial [Parafilimonas sp.]
MKSILQYISFILISFSSVAQGNANNQFKLSQKIHLSGTIQDSITAHAVAGATIELTNTANINSASYFKRSAIANFDGQFTLENIPPSDTYILTIIAIGYKTIIKEISLSSQDNKNIGIIKMITETKMLANVVVTTTAAPSMQFGIDRKIFNVEKNITAQGGTAVDVMKNIPSLSVDVDGNLQMRNSTPQILIDGRPTILTLDQIPADDIERVELITNPSAKYDASSSGGIINIVMKKNKRTGLNGIASIGAGAPDLLNGNINLNLRQKNFNVFASGNYYTSKGNSKEETYRGNKDNDTITDYFSQVSNNDR